MDYILENSVYLKVLNYFNATLVCKKQKEFLAEKGIEFEERDIHENEEYFQEFKDLGGYGTPFTIKKENGTVTSKIMGFNRKKLLDELTK